MLLKARFRPLIFLAIRVIITMKEISIHNGTQMMTSLEIAEVTGKNHFDVLRAIRKMELAWQKVTDSKFAVSEYKDPTGRTLPCYLLTKTECLYIATKFKDDARAKLVLRWEFLERERLAKQQQLALPSLYPRKHRELLRAIVAVKTGISFWKINLKALDAAYSIVFPNSTPINVNKKKRVIAARLD